MFFLYTKIALVFTYFLAYYRYNLESIFVIFNETYLSSLKITIKYPVACITWIFVLFISKKYDLKYTQCGVLIYIYVFVVFSLYSEKNSFFHKVLYKKIKHYWLKRQRKISSIFNFSLNAFKENIYDLSK